ncbi:hypothetical protein A5711_10445 [Mycobacterium sp. E2238]|nr:hypothetical protein A5711_10445 [Mycobacterium sp. E2238]
MGAGEADGGASDGWADESSRWTENIITTAATTATRDNGNAASRPKCRGTPLRRRSVVPIWPPRDPV